MTAEPNAPELLSSAAGLGAAVATETGTELGEIEAVRARGYWEQVWRRFRRDKFALAGGVFVILLLLMAYAGAPLFRKLLGHGPNDIFSTSGGLINDEIPVGPWSHVKDLNGNSQFLLLGGDGSLARDEFLRLLYGAQVSLEVAIGATTLAMMIGIFMGVVGGYYGGWIDAVVSRVTEIVMAFPVLLFIIAVSATIGDRLNNITFHGVVQPGVFTLTIVIAIFGWYYPARIIRAVVLSLREKEFVEAARMTGASDWRIMRSHLLPHLIAPIIVYATLIVAVNILLEAGLSFLGLGVPLGTPSWGNLLATGPDFYLTQPWLMLWPGLAVLLTTLAFNLLGDGLRDAFDPRG